MKHLHIYLIELIIADVTNYCFPRLHEAKVSVSAAGLSLGEATTLYTADTLTRIWRGGHFIFSQYRNTVRIGQ